ncbi:MAG: hypothetical protein ACYDDO_06330 [Acidiferrobacterales bacterium]
MSTFIELLVARSRASKPRVDIELERALAQFDAMLEQLAADLQVEHYGPDIGLGAGAHVYRMVVRSHEWQLSKRMWSLRICTALPHARWRADWAIQGASRLRKQKIVRSLPDFLCGYARAIQAAGKAGTNSGQRVLELARQFSGDA